MAGSLEGRVILVTGGSDGIGLASGTMLAREGAHVAICGRDPDRLAAGEASVAAVGSVEAHRLDVGDASAFRGLIRDIAHRHRRLDGLVNNAMALAYKPVVDLSLDEWHSDFRVNSDAVFVGTQAAMQIMIPQGSGSIVNISSLNGLGAMPNMASYSASKAAMIHFSAVAAMEAGPHNVRINVIAPGQIVTAASASFAQANPERNERVRATLPMRRPGQPDEIAHVVRFLLSDEASYVTGTCIPVDGGKIQQLYVPS